MEPNDGKDNKAGGHRPGAGRKRVAIDVIEVEKLSVLHCTDEEIADFFGVSVRTIVNRRKQPEYAEAMRRGKARGRISVRRAQWKLLEAGHPQMCIWLGKQLLGQRDVTPVELSGPQGQPVQVSLQDFDAIVERARHSQGLAGVKSPGPAGASSE